MGAENREGASARARVRAARARLATTVAIARDWHWGAVIGKVLLAGLGLVLLGAIGRSALARSVLSTDPWPVDGGGVATAALPSTLPMGVGGSTVLAAGAQLSAVAAPAAVASIADGALPALAPAPPASPPSSTRSRATPDDPVYLNQATVADLRRLPGVGAKRAEAILSLRTRLGHFRQIEDLLKVKGVGRSSLRKLRPLVRLDPPPARVADAGSGDGAAS